MKFSNDKMSNAKVQAEKIGGFAKRSTRNKWAEEHEELIRELAPYPISYDVTATQTTGFSEFSYTEICGGMWLTTQSLELNCRLIDFASKQDTDVDMVSELEKILADKYTLNKIGEASDLKRVCFLPGHNLLDVASVEIISRLAHENEDVFFKPHPITNDDAIRLIAKRVGWNKIIHKDISGYEVLNSCDEVYTSSASEMAITGTVLGKKIFNISNFFNEGSGTYYPFSRILFKAQETSIEEARKKLNNILACKWSGILFPFHTDVEERTKAFYDKALELRELYKPLAAPRGNIEQESKRVVNGQQQRHK